MATTIHAFSTTLGGAESTPPDPYPLSSPEAVAVDNSGDASKGDVYVADTGNRRIEKFDSSGNFILMFGKGVNKTTGGNVCTATSGDICQAGESGSSAGELETPTFVAVDGSSGPSAGDVYVGDTGDSVVSKFDSTGNLITSWGNGGQLAGIPEIGGLAVDTSGNLFVLDPLFYTTNEGEIHKFEQDGNPITQFGLGTRGTTPFGVAVSPAGYVYKVAGNPNIEKYTSTGEDLGEVDGRSDATGLIVDPATEDLYVAQGEGLISRFAADCSLNDCEPIETFGAGHLNNPQGVGVDATTGTVYAADSGSGTVAVLPEGILPEAVTGSASEVGLYSATLSGTVEPEGGGDVTSCKFEYGTDTTYSLGSVPCEQSPPFSGPENVTAKVSGLVNNTIYHYRVVATNARFTNTGQDGNFKTLPAIENLSTDPATEVTGTSAMINGSWTGNGEETTYYFEWGFNTLYGNKTAVPPGDEGGSGLSTVHVEAALTGLGPTTTYHYRIVASNSRGTTFGPDEMLSTLTFPAIKPLQTSALETTSLHLNALVEPTSGAVSDCYFEYGTAAGEYDIGTAPCEPALPYSGNTEVSAGVSGLAPGTIYHYRLVLSSPAGTASESDQTFTTAPLLPTITGSAVSETTGNGATLTSDIRPGFGPTLYFIEYGESTSYGASSPVAGPLPADNELHQVTAQLTGLNQNKTYHFRTVAINFGGATRGPDQTLVTAGVPQVVSASASNVTATSVSLSAQVIPDKEPTTYHFEYGVGSSSDASTLESGSIGSDAVPHSASASLVGLTPNTTYRFRAVATNSVGVTHGVEGMFTTLPAEEIRPPAGGLRCKRHFIKRHDRCVKKTHHKRRGGHENG